MIKTIKKYLQKRKRIEKFNNLFGVKGKNRQQLVQILTELGKPKGTKADFFKCLKENSFRGRLYFQPCIKSSNNHNYITADALILVSEKDIHRVKEAIDKIRIFGCYIRYEKLKWYQGWFPRYKFLRGFK